jgi:hypothetical protein
MRAMARAVTTLFTYAPAVRERAPKSRSALRTSGEAKAKIKIIQSVKWNVLCSILEADDSKLQLQLYASTRTRCSALCFPVASN